MKLTIEKSLLAPMLSKLKHGIGSNTILPILDNIKIYTKDGMLYMQTTDNNLAVTVCESLGNNLLLDSDYSFLLHSSAIPLLDQLKVGEIEIEGHPNSNMVSIKQQKNIYKFGMENVLDYPSTDNCEYQGVCELDFVVLKEALTNAMTFVATDDGNIMRGILLEIDNQKMKVVSTNAHFLLRTEISCQSEVLEKQRIIIPTKIVAALKSVKYSGVVKISISENNCMFSFGNTVFKQRLIDGNYPQYETVLPKSADVVISMKKAEFVETLKRLNVLTNKTTNGLIMVFDQNKMCIVATDVDKGTDGKEYLNIECDTEKPMLKGFNERLMSSAINCLIGDKIEISLLNSAAGAITINEHHEDSLKTILVMPVMVEQTIKELEKLLL